MSIRIEADVRTVVDLGNGVRIQRGLDHGDMGRIATMQQVVCAREFGFDLTYESLVCTIVAEFVNNLPNERQCVWLAFLDDELVGSIFCFEREENVAQLRLLCVSEQARGKGVGGKLIEICVAFAREAGFKAIKLWTQAILTDARRLYDKAGFRLVQEDAEVIRFGVPLRSQILRLDFE